MSTKTFSPRPNRFAGACDYCGVHVAPGAGFLLGKDHARGPWLIGCTLTGTCKAPEPEPTPSTPESRFRDQALRLVSKHYGDVDAAFAEFEADAEWFDGEVAIRLSALVNFREAVGADATEARRELDAFEAFEERLMRERTGHRY